jgi:hypothetical protein
VAGKENCDLKIFFEKLRNGIPNGKVVLPVLAGEGVAENLYKRVGDH